jgi:serine/threonine protein kinase
MLHNDPLYTVIHRDLKPDNIMLMRRSGVGELYVKIVDFNGCAVIDKAQPEIAGSSSLAGSSSSLINDSSNSDSTLQCVKDTLPLRCLRGSPLYMAPEVAALFDVDEAAAAKLPGYDERVDVYALGAIAVAMAAGGTGSLLQQFVVPPGVSRSKHMASLIDKFVSGQLLLGDMTAGNMQEYVGLREFVGLCCARDPTQRPSIAALKKRGSGHAWLHNLS